MRNGPGAPKRPEAILQLTNSPTHRTRYPMRWRVHARHPLVLVWKNESAGRRVVPLRPRVHAHLPDVLQHAARVAREADRRRLVVVAELHRRLLDREAVVLRDVQELDVEPEAGDRRAIEAESRGVGGEPLQPRLRVENPRKEED